MTPGARTFHRTVFAIAAVYNVGFGLWAGLDPHGFFRLFELAAPRYPAIWACLGMVVGTYGLAYAAIALRPERGSLLAAIGLVGKVLGPLGWLRAVQAGELPPATFPLILFNDLVWWYAFLAYLVRDLAWRRTIVAAVALAANGLACLGILLVTGGTEAEPDAARRAAFVAAHPALWSAVWFLWVLASTGLVAFFCQWSSRLVEFGAAPTVAWGATAIVAAGCLFDLTGETINIAFLTRPGLSAEEFEDLARLYTLVGPAAANGLYCVGGLILALVSLRRGFVRGPLAALGFATWIVGLGLTGAAIVGAHRLMVVTGGGVMTLFLVWGSAVAWRFREVDVLR